MYLGGPVSAFCIGTLMTGVIGYRVEQYKLGIERKEASDISDEKEGKHLMKNIYDLLLIVICIVFFRSFILKKYFFEKEKDT